MSKLKIQITFVYIRKFNHFSHVFYLSLSIKSCIPYVTQPESGQNNKQKVNH